ncbi:3-keto-5-aminohexanoate cleavage protein [Enterovirga sp.]|uniref:3-keto-5-aminohexanoate cleavage protein n=1 Tax=Enterovirga sp. TaxID=2026350 RepID=UPI0026160666|nr:3-keto-5-aminohexanoate cleavage protein [Enterovirga sp.]MDB5589490.1 hypothetical protein [Enterovirga sp.]
MAEVWIEAALNGPWGRERQPGIPITVEEIVQDGLAAAAAGAAIVHVHAYDPATGRQRDEWEIYARIIEGIRARCDAIVYPTVPLAGSGYAGAAVRRYGHVEELARRGLIEWAVLDPGSVTFARFDELRDGESGFTYLNSMADIRDGLGVLARYRVRPGYAVYEPGFTRLGAALAELHPDLPQPIYRFMFSDEFAWGFPPRPAFLEAHLALLAEAAPGASWMAAGLGVDILPLAEAAVARGGHLRVGLEDAPWGSARGNEAWVAEAARRIVAAGGAVAGPQAVRRSLAPAG